MFKYEKEIIIFLIGIIITLLIILIIKLLYFNEKRNRIICSLTTIPERVEKGTIIKTLKSLNEQTVKPDIIYINISNELNNKKYDIDKLNEMKKEHPNLVINIVDKDIGPITKLIPVIKLLKNNDKLLLVDDDVYYDKKTIEILLQSKKQAVGFYGFKKNKNGEFDYICDITKIKEVDILETFHGVLYDSYILSDLEEFNKNLNGKCFKQDDIKISKYLKTKGVKMFVIPKSKDMKTIHDAQDTTELRTDNLNDGNKNCFKELF
jgi:hypothetical protein